MYVKEVDKQNNVENQIHFCSGHLNATSQIGLVFPAFYTLAIPHFNFVLSLLFILITSSFASIGILENKVSYKYLPRFPPSVPDITLSLLRFLQ